MALVNIAKLTYCCELDCAFSEDLHLTIDYQRVELGSSQAIAISYAWGRFERTKAAIGHAIGQADKPVFLELGKEWVAADVMAALAEISIDNGDKRGPEHAGIWMDQLCISQDEPEEIRQALAEIPSVYRTLDVVILLPGGRCRCLDDLGDNDPVEIKKCFNALGIGSHFDRQWTRQELQYSRNIRVVRASNEELPCLMPETDGLGLVPESMPLFWQLLYAEIGKAEPGLTARDTIWGPLKHEKLAAYANAMEAIAQYNRDFQDVRRLLVGESLTRRES